MARLTIPEKIAKMEAELVEIDNILGKNQGLREVEEGGQGTRFRSSFTSATDIYEIKTILETKLELLYRATV